MNEPGKMLFIIGLMIALVGLLVWSGFGKGWLGRMPGDILETAGEKCARLLDRKIKGLSVEQVQVDEVWSYVHSKQVNAKDPEHGDAYTFLAIDRHSKLIISHHVGKRDDIGANALIADLKKRVATYFQLSSDSFRSYIPAVNSHLGAGVAYAQLSKQYDNAPEPYPNRERRYSPPRTFRTRVTFRLNHPAPDMICTSHVERFNLSVRLFNRRFTRLALGYSKKLANLKHSVALFIAHFNFCRAHSAHKHTPAMEAGLTDHTWTFEELLTT